MFIRLCCHIDANMQFPLYFQSLESLFQTRLEITALVPASPSLLQGGSQPEGALSQSHARLQQSGASVPFSELFPSRHRRGSVHCSLAKWINMFHNFVPVLPQLT